MTEVLDKEGMERHALLDAIADMIEIELDRFDGETLANSMRCAAVFVHEAYPQATSADFGDAAVMVERPGGFLHRQASMNRWNEAKANCGGDW